MNTLIFKVWLIVTLMIFCSYNLGYKSGLDHGKKMFMSDAFGNISMVEKK